MTYKYEGIIKVKKEHCVGPSNNNGMKYSAHKTNKTGDYSSTEYGF